MFIENPYQWGVSYDYALPLSENTLLHIHSHGAIHTYKLMRMYVKRFSPEWNSISKTRTFFKKIKSFSRKITAFFLKDKSFFLKCLALFLSLPGIRKLSFRGSVSPLHAHSYEKKAWKRSTLYQAGTVYKKRIYSWQQAYYVKINLKT